jgi:hypothetical protein
MHGTGPDSGHKTSSVKKILEEAEERLLRTSQFLARSKGGSAQASPIVQPL